MSIRLYEKLKAIYFTRERFRDLSEQYGKCKYSLSIHLEADKYTNHEAVKQNTLNNAKRKKDTWFYSITIGETKIFSLDKKKDIPAKELQKGCIDVKHTGELIFLLALKLKYDFLSKTYSEQNQEQNLDYDSSFLLHVKEIANLYEKCYTQVSPTIWRSIYHKLKPESLNGFTFLSHPSQLYHLVGYSGNVGQKGNDPNVFGWLNVLPEDVRIFNIIGHEVKDAELYNFLKFFFDGCLLKPDELEEFYKQMAIGGKILKYENEIQAHKSRNALANITNNQNTKAHVENLNLRKTTINMDPEKKGQMPLSYKYRWPKIIYGRDEEIKRFYQFVNHPNENLLWWAIIGKGGSGKSRIALELCFELEKEGWYAGFLTDPREIEVLKTWKPLRPTLIVIDYTYEKAKIFGECISNYKVSGPMVCKWCKYNSIAKRSKGNPSGKAERRYFKKR